MTQWQNKEAGWKNESDTNSTDRSLQAGRCQHNIRAVVYTGFRSSAARGWSGWNEIVFRSKDTGLAPLRLEQIDPGPGTNIWFFPKASFRTVTFPCRENQSHRRDMSEPTPSCPVQHGWANNATKLFVLQFYLLNEMVDRMFAKKAGRTYKQLCAMLWHMPNLGQNHRIKFSLIHRRCDTVPALAQLKREEDCHRETSTDKGVQHVCVLQFRRSVVIFFGKSSR